MGVTHIYSLSDPRTNRVRYVGKANQVAVRFRAHKAAPSSLRMRQWLAELSALGLEPVIGVIEKCALTEWRQREIFWIAYYRADPSADLLNICDGGDGLEEHCEAVRVRIGNASRGLKRSPEVRARMSEAQRVWKRRPMSESHKRKVSLALRGKPKTAVHRLAVIAAITGKKKSPAVCAKMSETTRRCMTPEVRAKISASLTGKRLSLECRLKISRSVAAARQRMRLRHAPVAEFQGSLL